MWSGMLISGLILVAFGMTTAATVLNARGEKQSPSDDAESSTSSSSSSLPEQQEEEPTTMAPNEKQHWKLAPLIGLRKEDLHVELYQYEACPFCCKVKAYLDYHKIPYKIIEVNPVFKREMKHSNYKKVPFLIVNGIQVNDSSNIINEIHNLLNPGYFDFQNLEPSTREQRERELHWRSWVDRRLVHLLPPNIYRTYSESIQAFDYITDVANFSWSQKIAAKWGGSTVMYAVSKRLKTKYNIVDERKELYDSMNLWMDEIATTGKPFLGGDSPNMADLQVYGVLTSIEGLDTFHDMRKNTKSGVWYDRMKEAVGTSSRLNNFRKSGHNTVTIEK